MTTFYGYFNPALSKPSLRFFSQTLMNAGSLAYFQTR